ncbi:restriction endonuclease subunit S [Chryseobacterium arthrosphaerae]|uniref:restriction endonuclease subunit S n=1 Tax=Chryseobacterium arthrosphaerae TaxID=651561 RepID=UPI0023E1AEA0|nr:restriction endonuclease subunit S [Chryseobacterium arthrosphaerae]WES99721.1 restriction endonuclease subunit S [Chryseobacterium arthrosphaerae]
MENSLPKSWVNIKISDFASTSSGGTPKTNVKEYWDGNIPWINSGMLKDNVIKDYSKLITERGLKESSAKLFPNKTVVIALTGATTGKVGILDIETSTNQSVTGIFPNVLYESKYLFYYLISIRNKILENALGTAQPHINKAIVDNTIIPFPPLSEQKRIVAKLDVLFAQHEAMKKALERIPKLLEDFRQQVLTHAVTGNLIPFRGGSQNMKLKDLGIWKGGGTPSKANSSFWNNGTILWITPKDMKDLFLSNSIDKITKSAVQNSSAILIPKNSILIVTRSGILRRLLPISSNSVETTVNQDLKVLIPNDKVNFKFLLYALRGLEENIRMTCMKSGTTVESIEFSLLKDYNINIPILSIQQAIVEKIESLLTKADIIEKRYKTLKEKIDRLPQAILHKAFKGELVPQLPTDGDAKDLLEEILKLKKEVKKK